MLSTLALYKSFAGIDTTDATRDAAIIPALSAADDAIKRYLRQNIEYQSYDLILDAYPTTDLVIPQLPVVISTVQLWMNWQANGNPANFTSGDLLTMYEDFQVEPSQDDYTVSTSGILRLTNGTWFGVNYQRNGYVLTPKLVPVRGAIRLSYSAGFTVVPPSITEATNLVVSKMFGMRKLGAPLSNESLNGYSYGVQSTAFANGIIQGDPTIKAMLRPFGRQVFVGTYF